MEELLTMRRAAELLTALLSHPHTPETIRGLIRRGRLPCVRDGRRVRVRREALRLYASEPVRPRRGWTLP